MNSEHISYTKHITNTEVQNRVQQDRQLLNMIGKRQLRFLGHVIRKNNLKDLSLSGRFEGKRARSRQTACQHINWQELHTTYEL